MMHKRPIANKFVRQLEQLAEREPMLFTAHAVTGFLRDEKHEALQFGPTVDVERAPSMNEEGAFQFLARAGFYPDKHARVERIHNSGAQSEGFLLKNDHGHPVAAVFKVASPARKIEVA